VEKMVQCGPRQINLERSTLRKEGTPAWGSRKIRAELETLGRPSRAGTGSPSGETLRGKKGTGVTGNHGCDQNQTLRKQIKHSGGRGRGEVKRLVATALVTRGGGSLVGRGRKGGGGFEDLKQGESTVACAMGPAEGGMGGESLRKQRRNVKEQKSEGKRQGAGVEKRGESNRENMSLFHRGEKTHQTARRGGGPLPSLRGGWRDLGGGNMIRRRRTVFFERGGTSE